MEEKKRPHPLRVSILTSDWIDLTFWKRSSYKALKRSPTRCRAFLKYTQFTIVKLQGFHLFSFGPSALEMLFASFWMVCLQLRHAITRAQLHLSYRPQVKTADPALQVWLRESSRNKEDQAKTLKYDIYQCWFCSFVLILKAMLEISTEVSFDSFLANSKLSYLLGLFLGKEGFKEQALLIRERTWEKCVRVAKTRVSCSREICGFEKISRSPAQFV